MLVCVCENKCVCVGVCIRCVCMCTCVHVYVTLCACEFSPRAACSSHFPGWGAYPRTPVLWAQPGWWPSALRGVRAWSLSSPFPTAEQLATILAHISLSHPICEVMSVTDPQERPVGAFSGQRVFSIVSSSSEKKKNVNSPPASVARPTFPLVESSPVPPPWAKVLKITLRSCHYPIL